MKVSIVQLVVQRDIASNSRKIVEALRHARPDEWMVFPEAAVSGYEPADDRYAASLDWNRISEALDEIRGAVAAQRCHCVIGTAMRRGAQWRNTALVLSHANSGASHDKIQLSSLDRRHFVPGDRLETFHGNDVTYGLQACRELLFPAQWSTLKAGGAQVVFHLNNAVQPHDALWKHVLIARAVEQSVFVVSVNNAAPPQALASYVIGPNGQVLAETTPQAEETIGVDIDPDSVIGHLSQRQDY
jgi:predicted amidohydrolase